MTVLSPVRTTMPSPLPSGTSELENARLAVSKSLNQREARIEIAFYAPRGLSWVHSVLRSWGSASPVMELLST